MTTQPDHQAAAAPRPATLHELRTALSRYGLPGDREQFEKDVPVADRREQDLGSGFIQDATGWKPGPLQPLMNVHRLAAAAGLQS
ncbi:hypothetical protein [Kitasatospora sp. NPDC004272]